MKDDTRRQHSRQADERSSRQEMCRADCSGFAEDTQSVPAQTRLNQVETIAMKHLVTGGAGFIGSNIAQRLAASGRHVRVLDDLSSNRTAPSRRQPSLEAGLAHRGLVKLVDNCDSVGHRALRSQLFTPAS
jgi:hypothetical protein